MADLVGVGALAAVTALVAFGVVVPTTLHEHAAAAEAQAAARTRQRAGTVAVAVRTAEAEVQRAKARIAAAPLAIRPLSALNERLATLVALAGECGLGVSEFKPAEAVRGPRFVVTPVRLGGTGRYADVVKFLHRLPDRMPDLALSGLRVQGDGAGGQYTLEARWYASPGEAAPNSVPAVPASLAVVP